MRHPPALLAAALGALLLVLGAGARPAAAHHEDILPVEQAYPYWLGYGYYPHSVSYVVRNWQQHAAVTWNSDTTTVAAAGGKLDDHARAAVASWRALDAGAFANTVWTEYTSGPAQIEFRWVTTGSGLCPAGADACVVFVDQLYSPEAAYYVNGAAVRVKNDEPRSPNGLRAALAHEIGHLYGLAENYHHTNSPPAAATESVMNAAVWGLSGTFTPSSPGSSCSAGVPVCIQGAQNVASGFAAHVAPTTEDQTVLKKIWRGNPANDGTGVPKGWHAYSTPWYIEKVGGGAGYTTRLHWFDYAWAEFRAVLYYQKWNAGAAAWDVVYVYYEGGYIGRQTDAGGHRAYTDDEHLLAGDLQAWGAGTYRACGYPYYVGATATMAGEVGQTQCTASISYP